MNYYIPEARPFWFAESELLTDLLRAEISDVTRLLKENVEASTFFDAPEATIQQRNICFALLAHRKVMDIVYETFAGQYQQSPSLGDEESWVLNSTSNLVAADAPTWALEAERVANQLPTHLFDALPQPLRAEGFRHDDQAQMAAIRSAICTLNTAEKIRALVNAVLDRQLTRLAGRWYTAVPLVSNQRRDIHDGDRKPLARNKVRRTTRDKRRANRDAIIREIDQIAKDNAEFLRLMDAYKVEPQPTWRDWPNSWVTAYLKPGFRKLIQQDKSRALSRAYRSTK